MRNTKLTVKNYRCFSDGNPLQIRFGDSAIAFIGPNNSGKSAALKFFYELRTVWQYLLNLTEASGGAVVFSGSALGFYSVDDPARVFCFDNGRDIDILFEIEPSRPDVSEIQSINISISRRAPHITTIKMKSSRNTDLAQVSVGAAKEYWIIHPLGEQVYISNLKELFTSLYESFYIGAFRNAINQTANNIDYYDIRVGRDFVELWDQWKSGVGLNSTRNAKRILAITRTIQEMYGFSQLDINPSSNNQGFNVVVDGEVLPLNDLGSGLAQCLIVLSNVAIKSPRLLLIDEPELNLHPALQQRFIEQLAEFAPDGIIFATHSLGLARTTADPIYSFKRSNGRSTVHRYDAIPNLVEFLGEMSFAAQKELGYDRILLVEGLHDVKVFKQILRFFDVEHRTVVLFMGGNQMATSDRAHELIEIKRLSDKVFAIADSEREAEMGEPSHNRTSFQKTCNELSIPVLLTTRRAIENYFSDRAIKAALGDSHGGLAPYQALNTTPNGWHKSKNWKIAAEMSRAEFENTDVGMFIREVVSA